MADLSNITNLSGLTITSDQSTGTTNPNATFAVASLTQTQINLLQNVTPYTVGGNTNVRVKNGTMVFNITLGLFQLFRNAQWENISTNIRAATGVGLTSAPFSIPSGPRASVEVPSNQINGFTYFDSTNTIIRTYKNAWQTITSA